LIPGNVNYVKKVIFPLEILPIVALGSAAFHFLIGLVVWLVFYLLFFGVPSPTALQLPLIIFPLVLMTLGFSWFLLRSAFIARRGADYRGSDCGADVSLADFLSNYLVARRVPFFYAYQPINVRCGTST
jgi:hypothetical protein